MAETMIECICENCGTKFSRRLAEVNRNKKLNRKVLCSLKCSGKVNLINIPSELIGNIKNITKRGFRRTDEYTPFRRLLSKAKQRALKKNIIINISLKELLQQWNKQNGICPYTGKTINLVDKPYSINQASIDRIDSSKGYTVDNIEFVSLIAQYAKNKFSKEQVIEFCKLVTSYHS